MQHPCFALLLQVLAVSGQRAAGLRKWIREPPSPSPPPPSPLDGSLEGHRALKTKTYCEPLDKVRAEILGSSKKPKEFCCGMGCEEVLCQYCLKQTGRDYQKRCHDKCLKQCRLFKVETCGKGKCPAPFHVASGQPKVLLDALASTCASPIILAPGAYKLGKAGPLQITRDVEIKTEPDAKGFAVLDGQNKVQVLRITSGIVTIHGLNITGGYLGGQQDGGAGVLITGTSPQVTMSSSEVNACCSSADSSPLSLSVPESTCVFSANDQKKTPHRQKDEPSARTLIP